MAEPMTRTSRAVILPRHKVAPGPHGHFLLGNAGAIQRDPLGFGLTMTHQYGDVVRMRFFA